MNEWEIQFGQITSICFLCLTFYWHPKTFTWQCHQIEIIDIPNYSPIFFQCHRIEMIDIPKPFTNLLIISSNWDDWFSQTILTVSVQCSPIIPPRTKNLLEVPKALAAHIDHHQPAICNSLSFYSFPKNNWIIDRVLNFPVVSPSYRGIP